MKYKHLYDIIKREGIKLIHWDFVEPIRGIYLRQTSTPPFIGISTAIIESPAEYCSVLGEEVGHHFTIPSKMTYMTCLNFRDRLAISTLEYKAIRWAANYMIDIEDIRSAFLKGCYNQKQLSEFLGLTEELIMHRMCMPDAVKLCYEHSFCTPEQPLGFSVYPVLRNHI